MSSLSKKLFEIIKNGNLSEVKLILQNYNDLSIINEEGEFPLYIAAKKGDLEIVKYLVKLGANFNQRITSFKHWPGGTAITIAAMKRHWEIVRFLVEVGGDVNSRDIEWMSSLHWATYWNEDVSIVSFLIEHGALVVGRNYEWETPLHYSAMYGNIQVAKLLIEHGAEINSKDMKERTPLDIAKEEGNIDFIKYLQNLKY